MEESLFCDHYDELSKKSWKQLFCSDYTDFSIELIF